MRNSASRLLAAISFLALVSSSLPAVGAVNPLDPGLPDAKAYGQAAIPANGASALCVECHAENPKAGMSTHFVLNFLSGQLRHTNSGGGWQEGNWGVRDKGEFFKVSKWEESLGGSGGYSKYGDAEKWDSVVYLQSEDQTYSPTSRVESQLANMGKYELICESCHSLKFNVEGRYNLLSRIVSSDQPDQKLEGGVADLCVGCHGFLYHDDGGAANSINANWSDPRNVSEITGQRRGNNEVHYISGQRYPRNHHVMTGDSIDMPVVNAGLTVRDVKVLDPGMVSSPIRTDSRKGTMKMRVQPLPPMLLPVNPASLNCVTCHARGHGGELSMGAAILIGHNLRGKDTGYGIDRISDGKPWGRFNDTAFCGACHE